MPIAFDESRTAFQLGREIGRGGEGAVHQLEGQNAYCAKIYHQRPAGPRLAKLRALRAKCGTLKDVAALPISIAHADQGLQTPIGVFLPFVDGREVFELYGTRSRIACFPGAKFSFLVHAAYNVAAAFDELHKAGIVVGDVNEQNVIVLPDATVRFIDCDSFQISDGAATHTSNVGTPLWTPPELHGRDLTGVVRSPHHDLFGLAQMIFLLLFSGRHPFAGRPRRNQHLAPDDAIRQFAYAFAPDHLALPLLPPPGCPSITSLPENLQVFFGRAFLRGADRHGARPSADEWAVALGEFSKALVKCSRSQAHVYWRGLNACPWCAIVSETGVDLFPPGSGSVGNGGRSYAFDDAYLTRLCGLSEHTFVLVTPAATDGLTPDPLPPEPTGFFSALHRAMSHSGWKRGWITPKLEEARQMLAQGETAVAESLSEQARALANYKRGFAAAKGQLQPIVQSLRNPSDIRKFIESDVSAKRRQVELTEFLERFSIRRANIREIGESRKMTLLSYGIETAADISMNAILRVKGFGPARAKHLLTWRNDCELRFRFNPSAPLPQTLRDEIENRFNSKIKALKEEASRVEVQFHKLKADCSERLRVAQAMGAQWARRRDQARVNIAFLEYQLR